MAHCNGRDTVMAAIEAGTDSIEHGCFMDAECRQALAESRSIWVPTIAAIAAFAGRSGSGSEAVYTVRPGFDPDITRKTVEELMKSVSEASKAGAMIAAGSDSGAFGVPHGSGTETEYRLLRAAGLTEQQIAKGNRALADRFMRR